MLTIVPEGSSGIPPSSLYILSQIYYILLSCKIAGMDGAVGLYHYVIHGGFYRSVVPSYIFAGGIPQMQTSRPGSLSWESNFQDNKSHLECSGNYISTDKNPLILKKIQ
jgi:hypothetical protein